MLVHTVFDDSEQVFAALCMGASGYLLKSTPGDKILEALIDTRNGGSPMTPHIARKVLTMLTEGQNILPVQTEY